MSGPLELYRTTVNLRGLGVGAVIEIDPTDEGWAGDIRTKRIVPHVYPEAATAGIEVVDPVIVDPLGPLAHDHSPAPEGAAWRGGGAWMDAAGESGPR